MAGSAPVIDQWYDWPGNKSSQNLRLVLPETLRGQAVEWIFYIYFSAGAAAGKIQIQTIPDLAYGGSTWANVGSTIDFAAENSFKYAAVTGCFGVLGLNIDTAITTGTVRAYVIATPV